MLSHLSALLLVLCLTSPCYPVLPACPSGCCCPLPGLLVLCESLGLRSLPHTVPLSTSVLSVARNHLCNVDNLLWQYSGLQELSLNQNQLSRFPRGLPASLKSLQLQENLITYITAGALRHLGNLTRLDLEDNRIRAIQPGALLGLMKLKSLTLKGNKLTSLPLYLPPSLTHLDVSENCISALDLPSLATLVNLQVLKINSNCLRSVPERAFDRLSHLRSVELANNLWVCECDIMYLYRWLLTDRLTMATDLVCTTPLHLAHRLLLTLSVMAICPKVLRLNETSSTDNISAPSKEALESSRVERAGRVAVAHCNTQPNKTTAPRQSRQLSKKVSSAAENRTEVEPHHHDLSRSHIFSERYTLEGLSYEDCLSLNSTHLFPVSTSTPLSSPPDEETNCQENATGRQPGSSSTVAPPAVPLVPTRGTGLQINSTPQYLLKSGISSVVAMLAVLCVLIGFLILAVVLVLKQILLRNQRVAPLQQS